MHLPASRNLRPFVFSRTHCLRASMLCAALAHLSTTASAASVLLRPCSPRSSRPGGPPVLALFLRWRLGLALVPSASAGLWQTFTLRFSSRTSSRLSFARPGAYPSVAGRHASFFFSATNMHLYILIFVACAGAVAALKSSPLDIRPQVLPAGSSALAVVPAPLPDTSHRLARRSARCHRLSRTSRTASHTTTSASSSSTSAVASTISSKGSGLFGVSDDKCGASGATEESSASGGPNGSEDWLNCGISKESPDSGWVSLRSQLSRRLCCAR